MAITVAFFLSGGAALILQVLWTRMLGLVLGASALAVSTVLTVFMGGLALGSHLGGRAAPRISKPLLAFSGLEMAIGLYGLLVPGLFETLVPLQQGVAELLGEARWGHALVRFSLATLVLFLPTVGMGATLPLLAEATVQRTDRLAERTGELYAANTLGAVAGALAAGFYLIPTFGVSATIKMAAFIDCFVAVLVLSMFGLGRSKARRSSVVERRSATARLLELEPSIRVAATAKETRRALVCFALSGAAAMALEVLWTRAVGVVIGASTYAFTLILVTFLVGLAGGAAWASQAVGRIRDPLRRLAQVEMAAGVGTLLAAVAIDRLPLWLHGVARDEGLGHLELYVTQFLMAGAVTLPSTLALGAVMPLVLAVVAPSESEHAGPVVGRAYALNTVGAIAGSFAGGFIILPGLGVERGLSLCGLSAVAIGLFLLKDRLRRSSPELVVAAAAVAVALLAPRWDIERWTAGLFRFYLVREFYSYGWGSTTEVIYHRDGVATTVTVGKYRSRQDHLGVVLKVNGKVDASDIGDMPTQVLSGLMPVLLHDHPRDALVIGYGSGVTPGALLRAPIRSLWVAEIESAVYEASNTHFAHVNHRPFEDPRAHLVVDDGRNFLLTRKLTFDLIISEPSNPWMSGAASLFTLDFFEVAKRRLNPGGLFLQWLQLYELSPASIHTLMRTFGAAFSHVLVFTPDPHSNDIFLIGSMSPLAVDHDRVERWLENPDVAAELQRARVFEPADLVGLYFMDGPIMARWAGPGPLNTDDNALIEHAAPLDLLEYATRDASMPFRRRAEGRRRALVAEGPFRGFPEGPQALLHRGFRLFRQGRLADAQDHAEEAEAQGVSAAALLGVLAAARGPDDQPVVVADDSTRGHLRYAEAVHAMMDGRDRDALALVELDDDPRWTSSPAHAFLRGFLLYREDRIEEAVATLNALAHEDGFVVQHPEVLFYAGRAAAEAHAWTQALEHLQRFEMTLEGP